MFFPTNNPYKKSVLSGVLQLPWPISGRSTEKAFAEPLGVIIILFLFAGGILTLEMLVELECQFSHGN